jgi:hypothetical protein
VVLSLSRANGLVTVIRDDVVNIEDSHSDGELNSDDLNAEESVFLNSRLKFLETERSVF